MIPTAVTAYLILVAVLGYHFGLVRALVAVTVGSFFLWLGVNYFRAAGQSPPDLDDLPELPPGEQRYVCSVCGLELTVAAGSLDKPPTHCREKMELVTVSGSPPLRPIS